MRSTLAALAIPMLRDAIAQRISAQMGNLAKEIDGRLLVAIFEFTVCRAHATQRLNLAPVADRGARPRLIADFAQRAFPAFAETALPNVVALLVRYNADTHRAVGIDGAARHAAAAGVLLLFCLLHDQWHGEFFFGHAAVVFLTLRLGEIQLDHLFGRDAHSEWALRAIDSRIDQRIEFEFDAELFLGQPLHFESLMLVDGGWHRLELQRQPSLQKQPDASHATVIGTGNLSERFVGFACRAIERYLDGEGTVFSEVVGDALVDHGPVREQGDQETALLGFRVNLKKILAREDLTAGVKQPQAAGLDQLIEEAAMLIEREFRGAGRVVADRKVVVAMQAIERTPARDLDRHLEGRAFPLETIVNQTRQLAISCRLHVQPFFSGTEKNLVLSVPS